MNGEKKINILNEISSGTIILSGRDKGELLREKIKLDKLEEQYDRITFVIPESIVSFNSSYFLGLFTPSIKKYGGKEGFLDKYTFLCDEYINNDILDGLKEALKQSNILK